MKTQALRHWQISLDDEEIVTATLDQVGTGANTLSREVMGELDLMAERRGMAPRYHFGGSCRPAREYVRQSFIARHSRIEARPSAQLREPTRRRDRRPENRAFPD